MLQSIARQLTRSIPRSNRLIPFRSHFKPTFLPHFYSTTPSDTAPSPISTPEQTESEDVEAAPKKTAIGKINRRLQITFTCTADLSPPPPDPYAKPTSNQDTVAETVVAVEGEEKEILCGHRSTHEFSRVSYEKGIVLIECPSCKNRHLIADNLSWFSDTPSPAHPSGLPLNTPKYHRTIEDLMKEKGEKVTWLQGEKSVWTVEG